jgi:hypothetical protein
MTNKTALNGRPFELGGETRLVRSPVINWRPGKFFFITLMIQSHQRNIHKTIVHAVLGLQSIPVSDNPESLVPGRWLYIDCWFHQVLF